MLALIKTIKQFFFLSINNISFQKSSINQIQQLKLLKYSIIIINLELQLS